MTLQGRSVIVCTLLKAFDFLAAKIARLNASKGAEEVSMRRRVSEGVWNIEDFQVPLGNSRQVLAINGNSWRNVILTQLDLGKNVDNNETLFATIASMDRGKMDLEIQAHCLNRLIAEPQHQAATQQAFENIWLARVRTIKGSLPRLMSSDEWSEVEYELQRIAFKGLKDAQDKIEWVAVLGLFYDRLSVVPVTTAECERHFSEMNYIKNARRNGLNISKVSHMMVYKR